jgi:CHAT domain-containing protein
VALLGDIAERRRLPEKQAEFERAVRRLSATLLGPLKDVALPRRLIVVLDGSLNRVPFAALRLPGTNTYLGLTHDLIRSPSASFLEAGREPRAPAEFRLSVLAIADPVFSLEDARVPATARKRFAGARTPDLARIPFMADIRAISRLVPESRRRILQGFDANPARIRELPLDQFGILHFSTHAIIDDRIPELSGIALSMVDRSGRPIDGFLHPHQLADWRLGGSVVVLSACDTGLGKLLMGEGLVGLSSSLFHAGAAQLVLSLAEVDADASAEFFSDVYRHVLARRPVPMERALTLARQEMARSDRWSDPYYWSTFVAIGRPSQDR